MPSSTLLGLSAGQLELVIAHELGHIRRLDYLVNLFQVSIETALFYHPAVGWISRRVRDEREKCVDDLVIGHCGHPIEYAKALADLERMRAGYHIAPAIGATDGQLLQRIERIVCDHTARPREAIAGNSMLLLLLAGVVLVAGQLADPMADLGSERNQLTETLISELVIGPAVQQSGSELVPMEISKAIPQPIQVESKTPVTETQQAAGSPLAKPSMDIDSNQRLAPIVASPRSADSALTEAVQQPAFTMPQEIKAELSSVPEQSIETPKVEFDSAGVAAPQHSAPKVARVSRPSVVTRVSPAYPVRARMAGLEGYVTVEFNIKGNGRVGEVRVIDSSPKRVFDNEARKTIRKWRFDPETSGGFGNKRFTQRFDFSLTGEQATSRKSARSCDPVTGTRICRNTSPTSLLSQETYSS